MFVRPTPRGVPTPQHDRGARSKRHPHRPDARPTALLETIERKILAALETGPKTLGQLNAFYLGYLKAEIRDQAVESLLKAGRVRLTTLPRRERGRPPMTAIALPKGE